MSRPLRGAHRWIPPAGAPRRRWLTRGLTTLGAVGLVVALVLAALWFTPMFRLNTVDYRTAPERVEALRQAASLDKGRPLVEVDLDRAREKALATQLFSSVEVSRSWPSTVVVEATPRTPVVAIREAGSSSVHLVDASGTAYEKVDRAPDGVLVAQTPGPVSPIALRTVVGVVEGLGSELAGRAENLRLDAAGRVTMDVEGVQVQWGDDSDPRLKGAVVRQLVAQPGVARLDVSAPMSPVTSDRRSTPSTGAGGAPRASEQGAQEEGAQGPGAQVRGPGGQVTQARGGTGGFPPTGGAGPVPSGQPSTPR